jgi:hypothetical protein
MPNWGLNENLDTGQFVAFGQANLRFSVKTQPPDLVRAGRVPFRIEKSDRVEIESLS